jgi:hypothetical protein
MGNAIIKEWTNEVKHFHDELHDYGNSSKRKFFILT